MRRLIALVTVACFLASVEGCARGRWTTVDRVFDKSSAASDRVQSRRSIEVFAYTTPDGVFHTFRGRIIPAGPDSLAFLSGTVSSGETPAMVLPRTDVATVYVRMTDPLRSTVAVIGVVAAVFVTSFAVALATKESCPFIYSHDGTAYMFDGEPYGGAVARGLERTDWSELEHLSPVGGKYRLLLANEVDETQHTNSIQLLVVDHAPGTKAVMDTEGNVHAFGALRALHVARDEATGSDLRTWLEATDYAAWYPDLVARAAALPLADPRDHIILEFQAPPPGSRAYLVSNVSTGQWGSHMLRTMLGMRGHRVGEFYTAVNENAASREQLLEWNDREELYHLFVELSTGDGWVRQGFIPGAGPFLSEDRALPLDLSGVAGDTVRLRVHPPVGFWSLNSFHLAWGEKAAEVITLVPEIALDESGQDVRPCLVADDSCYVDFPTTANRTELVYDVPSLRAGQVRTVFARTRGWYELHLRDLGEPDTGLEQLASQPGYMVERALRDFAAYRESGVLAGTVSPVR